MTSKWRKGHDSQLFRDDFFDDCWNIMGKTHSSSFGKQKKVIKECVASDVPEEKVKPWFRKTHLSRSSGEDVYQVMLDVSSFLASEISVKLLNEQTILVEGKHGEREEDKGHGFVAREFKRKYELPPTVRPDSLECFLSKDGVLVLRGHANPKSSSSPKPTENVIPVFTEGYGKFQPRGKSQIDSHASHNERIIPIHIEEADRRSVTPTPTDNSARSDSRGVDIRTMTASPDSSQHINAEKYNVDPVPGKQDIRSPSPTSFTGVEIRTFTSPDRESNVSQGSRHRTMSSNDNDDDDTLATAPPIIGESAEAEPKRATLSQPKVETGFARKSPGRTLLRRQEHISSTEESAVLQSSSSAEEKTARDKIERPTSPDVGDKSTTSERSRNSSSSSSHKSTRKQGPIIDFSMSSPDRRSPLAEHVSKLHQEIIDMHRQLSKDTAEILRPKSADRFQTSSMWRNRDERQFPIVGPKGLLQDLDLSSRWLEEDPNLKVRSSEQSREESYHKDLDKHGNLMETFSESFYFNQLASSDHTPYHGRGGKTHSINISSPA